MNKIVRLILLLLLLAALLAGTAYIALLQLYPRKYEAQIAALSKEFRVDPSLVYAVVNCESGFRPDARSDAGAIGLMQLTPDAFSWVQKKLDGAVTMESDALLNPDVNLRYGVALLRLHLTEFGGVEEALAAYHAGRGCVNGWLADPELSTDGATLASIPYGDTRRYVERVVKTRKIYRFLYHL